MKILENDKEYEVSVKENGDKFWYHKGKLHREAGPAIELASGARVWYFEGQKVNAHGPKEFAKEILRIKTASQKKYYDVKVESLVPAILIYKVLAANPEEAFYKIKHIHPNHIQYKVHNRKDIKATVYDAGSNLIKFVKNILGL